MAIQSSKSKGPAEFGMSDRRNFLTKASLLVAGAQASVIIPLTSGTGQAETPATVYAGPRAGPEAVVDTTSGKVRGMTVDGIKTFLGIPYGDDPRAKTASWHPPNQSRGLEFAMPLPTAPDARKGTPHRIRPPQ